MLPPVFLPDLRVGSSPRPLEERVVLRRGRPERLHLALHPPGASRVEPVVLATPDRLRLGRPSRLRVRLGLAFIAWGRHLAGDRAAASLLPGR